MTDFAKNMRREANDIASLMEAESSWRPVPDGSTRTNVKPFYSPLSAFKPGVDIAVVGIHPAGCPSDPPADSEIDVYEANLTRDGYNAYLDECWEGKCKGESDLQTAIRMVFDILFEDLPGNPILQSAVCFNVCPLRTSKSSQIPDAIWCKSVKWCQKMLRELRPKTVICVGNAVKGKKPIKSAWSAIRAEEPCSKPVAEKANLRFGMAELGTTHKARVVGIPHPTGAAYDPKTLRGLLAKHRHKVVGIEI